MTVHEDSNPAKLARQLDQEVLCPLNPAPYLHARRGQSEKGVGVAVPEAGANQDREERGVKFFL